MPPALGLQTTKRSTLMFQKLIRFYLKEEPIIKNVETYLCREPNVAKYVTQNLDKLVVKPVNESGGKGILIGPTSTSTERKLSQIN